MFCAKYCIIYTEIIYTIAICNPIKGEIPVQNILGFATRLCRAVNDRSAINTRIMIITMNIGIMTS